jgi:hypothetical protein
MLIDVDCGGFWVPVLTVLCSWFSFSTWHVWPVAKEVARRRPKNKSPKTCERKPNNKKKKKPKLNCVKVGFIVFNHLEYFFVLVLVALVALFILGIVTD